MDYVNKARVFCALLCVCRGLESRGILSTLDLEKEIASTQEITKMLSEVEILSQKSILIQKARTHGYTDPSDITYLKSLLTEYGTALTTLKTKYPLLNTASIDRQLQEQQATVTQWAHVALTSTEKDIKNLFETLKKSLIAAPVHKLPADFAVQIQKIDQLLYLARTSLAMNVDEYQARLNSYKKLEYFLGTLNTAYAQVERAQEEDLSLPHNLTSFKRVLTELQKLIEQESGMCAGLDVCRPANERVP